MPTTTVEIRWFRAGAVPNSLVSWFRDVDVLPCTDWERREDVYLTVPDSREIGIKCRGSSDLFEVKCRSSAGESVPVTPNITGSVEIWTKWSHEADDDWIAALTRRYPGSCRVLKARLKRYYRFAAAATNGKTESSVEATDLREVTAGTEIPRGGILEIASLQIGGSAHWSLAMEAFPYDDRLAQDVVVAAGALLADAPVELSEEESMGYPEWLTRITARIQGR